MFYIQNILLFFVLYNMAKNINVFINYQDAKSPFFIEPRCRLGRMKEVVSKSLGIKITRLDHYHHGTFIKKLLDLDDTKFLIEDCNLCANDLIELVGDNVSAKNLENMININWLYNGSNLAQIAVNKSCSVTVMQNMVKQSNLFVPDTIKLYYKDQYLSDGTKKLIEDIGIKDNENIEIKGSFFPLKHISKDLEFAQNIGVYIDTTCNICLEKLSSGKQFECGHVNVCNKCCEKYNEKKCPLCKN